MFDVLRFWMDHGVDGFRIDAYNHIFKHAEYKDVQIIDEKESGLTTKEAVNMFMYMKDQEEMFGLVKEISNLVCNQYGKYIATETYAPLDVLVRLYKSAAHRGYTTLNFSFLDMVWDAQLYKTFVDEFDAKIGTDLLPTYVLGNHDRERLATRIGLQQARASVLLLLTLRGIPYIYQGDELGMENVDIPVELLQDPWAKNFPGQKIGRDPVRTPFQWDNSPNAGFTEGTPWLPIAPDYQARNVKKESEDPTSMYNLYKKLLKLRKESEILIKGTYESLGINNKDIFAYTRKYGTEILIIAVNFSNKTQPITLVKNHGRLMCSTYMDQDDTSLVDLSDISLRPYEGCLYKVMHAA
jgi:alpha-glucosidase